MLKSAQSAHIIFDKKCLERYSLFFFSEIAAFRVSIVLNNPKRLMSYRQQLQLKSEKAPKE